MLCSALLTVPAYKEVLFNGTGIVPDVASLQAWIEKAWAAGYDPEGAAQLGHSLVGTRKYIGTTEAATLLRYFGIPARVVAFFAFDSSMIGATTAGSAGATAAAAARRAAEAELLRDAGKTPAQLLVPWKQQQQQQQQHAEGGAGSASASSSAPASSSGRSSPHEKRVYAVPSNAAERRFVHRRHVGMLQWLSLHFERVTSSTGGVTNDSLSAAPFPLFFQADGHSRTLAGFEVTAVTAAAAPANATGVAGQGASSSSSSGASDLRNLLVGQKRKAGTIEIDLESDGDGEAGGGSSSGSGSGGGAPAPKRAYTDAFAGGGSSSSTSTTMMSSRQHILTGTAAVSLLVFDPLEPAWGMERSLTSGEGWARRVKRGLHTLRDSEYEAMYVPRGAAVIPPGPERDALKVFHRGPYATEHVCSIS